MPYQLMDKLVNEQVLVGTMLCEVSLPNMARVIAGCGFQFVIVDCEHGYFDYSEVASFIGISREVGIGVIVRLPDSTRTNILKYIDMGADGLLLPMTRTAEDIEKVVCEAKYPPLGHRGISTTRSHNDYHSMNFNAYMEWANQKTMIFAQIETTEALLNLDAIYAVEGVAGTIIGPNDLSMDLGVFGMLNAPEMQKAVGQVAEAAVRAGKIWGAITSDTIFLRECMKKGMRICSCSSEVGMIRKQGCEIIRTLTE